MPEANELQLRCALINVENLFVLMDEPLSQKLDTLSEKGWRRLSSSIIKNKPLSKIVHLASEMKVINADIYLLVEVGGAESLENFSKYFLDDAYEVLLIEGNSDRAIDVGYLVRRHLPLRASIKTNKKRRLPFMHEHEKMSLATGYTQLVKRMGAYFSRDVAELHVRLNSSDAGIDLLFLLVHLKSKREGYQFDPQGAAKRKAELEGLVEIYLERRKALGPDVPIFVCGDFNGNASRIETEEHFEKLYESTDLEDLLELAGLPAEERITFHHIWGRTRRDQQLDYVFLSKGLDSVLSSEPYIYEYKSLGTDRKLAPPRNTSEKQRFPADHYPYVFEVKISH